MSKLSKEEYGGWGLNELEILQVQEEFFRGPGGMRMHLHYAMDLNWRILDDYGSEELKKEYMPKFQNKEVFTCFALTEATGGTGADLHATAVKDGDSYVLNGEKTQYGGMLQSGSGCRMDAPDKASGPDRFHSNT